MQLRFRASVFGCPFCGRVFPDSDKAEGVECPFCQKMVYAKSTGCLWQGSFDPTGAVLPGFVSELGLSVLEQLLGRSLLPSERMVAEHRLSGLAIGGMAFGMGLFRDEG